jgi:hypothetical protein
MSNEARGIEIPDIFALLERLWLCLVSPIMQNAKCQLLWNDEMQNIKIFIGVFSSIQNIKFFMGWVRAFWSFGFFFFFAS